MYIFSDYICFSKKNKSENIYINLNYTSIYIKYCTHGSNIAPLLKRPTNSYLGRGKGEGELGFLIYTEYVFFSQSTSVFLITGENKVDLLILFFIFLTKTNLIPPSSTLPLPSLHQPFPSPGKKNGWCLTQISEQNRKYYLS